MTCFNEFVDIGSLLTKSPDEIHSIRNGGDIYLATVTG